MPVKSLSTPSTQNSQSVIEPYQSRINNKAGSGSHLDNDYSIQLDNAVAWLLRSKLPPEEKVLLIILVRNGLRISEISDKSKLRVIDKWNVGIYTSKNLNWRVVSTCEAADLIVEYNMFNTLHLWKRNRFYYYRILKGLLPFVETQRNCNKAVTHAARNARAQMAFAATGSPVATSASIGNKSSSSSASYISKGKKQEFLKAKTVSPLLGFNPLGIAVNQ